MACVRVPAICKLGRLSGKSASPPTRLCTLMPKPLTRSSFRQEHRIASVGNGSVGVVVQEEEPRVSGAPPAPRQLVPRHSVLIPRVPLLDQTSTTTISSRAHLRNALPATSRTASSSVAQSHAPGTCRSVAWRAIEEVLVLQRVLAPRLFLGSVIYFVLARTLTARIDFLREAPGCETMPAKTPSDSVKCRKRYHEGVAVASAQHLEARKSTCLKGEVQ